jgi:hypothetical protein
MTNYEQMRIREAEDRQKREAAFDQGVDNYLDQLTRVDSIEDLLRIVRDAATWARDAHRADVARKQRRQP